MNKAQFMKYRVAAAVGSVVALSMAVAPVAHGQATVGDFGLSYGSATGLGSSDIRTTISTIINVALSLLGIIALIIVLIGGFKWMVAGGNEEKVTEARKLIFSGIIGLAIILSSYAIARFVLNQLGRATGATGTFE